MPKRCGSRSVVKTGEKIGRNVAKTGATRGKTAMKTGYVKAPKMLAEDAVQMLRQKVITEEPAAKVTNVRDRLTVLDLYKVTEKVTTETSVQPVLSAIAADISY
jgi:hypothetical protein